MTEMEYCFEKFNKVFGMLKDKRMALCVAESDSKEITERLSDYNIVCIVNEQSAGKYINNYYTVTFSQMIDLNIDYLILADSIHSAERYYRQINIQCKANNIKIYNLYGMDMFQLHNNLLQTMVKYSRLNEFDIIKAIDTHDVISFDIDCTLLTPRYLYSTDIYKSVEKYLIKMGISVENFVGKIVTLRSSNYNLTVYELLKQTLENEDGWTGDLESLWEVVFGELKKIFVPRRTVVDAFKYAVACGKKVCLIEDVPDYRLSKETWDELLREYGIEGYVDIFTCAEYLQNKYNGLYRVMQEKYGNKKYLHIGDSHETDILVPQLYGMDTFFIEHPIELFQGLDDIRVELLENKNVRTLFENYVIEVYNDNYLVSKAEQRRKQSKKLAVQFEEKRDFYKEHNEVTDYEPVLFDKLSEQNDIEEYTKLEFPVYKNPKVSIVIPVYNQFGYTYNCLKSILEYSGDISYEIIVADDCSSDQVKELEKVAIGITVLHNKRNLRFLLNCNNAAKYAKGEYLVFLNNDTQVQPNWLLPLVNLLDSNKDAGMVGAKLVYPDGYLQEAGGILWKDGSAWNYGNMKNPEEPWYCYVKEADYISGAAIMVRASLWKEIGGFDESFVPAYYEDTDLAYEVRKHGYKVLFQPQSVIVHFEGVSNGTDTASGLKSYQIVNQQKFYQKWKNVLEKEHFENGDNVFLAKDRGQTKKQILVVDHYVPNYDKDAGGRCTFMYIKAFLNLGMKVTFIGDNFAKPEPYTTILTQLGVEVLYGNYYCSNWQNWLKDNLKYFDYIYLQRPHISIKYIDLVREYGRGKIFYFAHDLGHIRLYRDYLVTGNQESLLESKKCKKMEMELFEKADVCHVVGSYEQEIMQEVFPDKPIRNIPLYIYNDIPRGIEKDFHKRKDIIFVGGFNHKPNVDAVLWFAKEVFPQILSKYPDIVWHIAGSNAPDEVKNLVCDNIILEGFVSDKRLGELYRKCRLDVVPLRYGAGVKGKVVEAAYYQIPLVTTTIGGEGLDDTIGAFLMEDDANKMADMIISLYTDYDTLKKMSAAGKTFIKKYFTPEVAKQVLLKDIDI